MTIALLHWRVHVHFEFLGQVDEGAGPPVAGSPDGDRPVVKLWGTDVAKYSCFMDYLKRSNFLTSISRLAGSLSVFLISVSSSSRRCNFDRFSDSGASCPTPLILVALNGCYELLNHFWILSILCGRMLEDQGICQFTLFPGRNYAIVKSTHGWIDKLVPGAKVANTGALRASLICGSGRRYRG